MVFDSSLSSHQKKVIKVGPPLTKLTGSAHAPYVKLYIKTKFNELRVSWRSLALWLLWAFYGFFFLVFVMPLCPFVNLCLVVTCYKRADLLVLVCGV